MNKLMDRYDYKITYGRREYRGDDVFKNWIGILPRASITSDTHCYRISYYEKDKTYIINNVYDEERDLSNERFYLVFPLLKLIEKAKKNGIKEVLVSVASKEVNKVLMPFFDIVMFGENRRKWVLNENRMLAVISMIETVTYHSSVWEIRHISSNILFRTKTGYIEVVWLDREETFAIREKVENDFRGNKTVQLIQNGVELEGYLRKKELVETFQPMMLENTKKMYYRLSPKPSSDITEEEIKKFCNEIENFLPLDEVEKQLIDKQRIDRSNIYKLKVNYYDFTTFIVGIIHTKNCGESIFVERKDKLKEMFLNYLNEDIRAEVNNFAI